MASIPRPTSKSWASPGLWVPGGIWKVWADKLVNYHAERAKGGCGLNMLEATYVAKNGNSYLRGVGISDDFMVRGLRRLTTAVHAHDGKIGVQLQHGGRTAQPKTSGHPIMLVSHVPGVTPYEESRVMDEEHIASVVTAYAQAAARAVESGFDLVELHAAHGYLLAQFLSPFTNRREDGYGGSFEKRLRFPLEVLQAVRTAVGPDYPVTIRLSVDEFMPGGMDLAIASEIARRLVARGVDALHVSVGLGETNHYTIPPSSIAEGWNAERAATIRKAVSGAVPVMVAGRIVTRAVAEDILAFGSADMVAMGRALIADPYLPNNFAAGKAIHAALRRAVLSSGVRAFEHFQC